MLKSKFLLRKFKLSYSISNIAVSHAFGCYQASYYSNLNNSWTNCWLLISKLVIHHYLCAFETVPTIRSVTKITIKKEFHSPVFDSPLEDFVVKVVRDGENHSERCLPGSWCPNVAVCTRMTGVPTSHPLCHRNWQSNSCLVWGGCISIALINWSNGEDSGIWGEAGGSISAEAELPSLRAGGRMGAGMGHTAEYGWGKIELKQRRLRHSLDRPSCEVAV